MSRRLFRFFTILVLVAACAGALAVIARAVLAGRITSDGSVLILRDPFALVGSHTGDLVVAAPAARIDATARVAGNASLVGENILIQGVIDGDLTVLATAVLIDGAQIGGDLHILAESAQINASRVGGESLLDVDNIGIAADVAFASPPAVCALNAIDERPRLETAPCPPSTSDPFRELQALRDRAWRATPLAGLGLAVSIIGAFAGLAALASAAAPDRVARIARGLRQRPFHAWAFGAGLYALATGAVGAAAVLLGVLPVLGWAAVAALLVSLALLAVMMAAGLFALSLLIGRRLLGPKQPLVPASAVGGAIIGAGLAALSLQPLGPLASLLILALLSAAGAGAAFGTQLGSPRPARAAAQKASA